MDDQSKSSGLQPAMDGAYYWHRQADGSYTLKSRWGHKPIIHLPVGHHPDKRAIAVLDQIVERLQPAQRAIFDRLAANAAHGLDPHAFVMLVPMIERGMTYDQLRKYVGAPEEGKGDKA